MKKLRLAVLTAALFVAAVFTAYADSIASALTGGTAAWLFTGNKIVDTITVTATTANTTTFKFYDNSTNSTSIVRAAYTSYASYATNWSETFTNESDVLVTNTFAGTFTGPTTVAAVTNERPKVLTIVVPGNTTRAKSVTIQTMRGLTAISDQNGIVEVDYRNNP